MGLPKVFPSYHCLSSSSRSASVARMAAISRLVVLILVVLFDYVAVDYDTSAHLDSPCLQTRRAPEGPMGEGGLGGGGEEGRFTGSSFSHAFPSSSPLSSSPSSSSSSSSSPSSSSSSSSSIPVSVSESWRWPHVWLRSALEGAITWDAVFFVRIARCGYEYEQMHAFLPLFPLLMRAVRLTVFRPLVHLIGERATLALAGYLINSTAFIFAAVFLFRLTLEVMPDEPRAFQAVSLFCYNPATIFYFSLYTESLFAAFVFGGLLCLVKGATWMAAILFGFSSLTRSNGVLNSGFFLFKSCHVAYHAIVRRDHPKEALKVVAAGMLQSLITVGPFVLFQWYGYLEYCQQNVGNEGNPPRPWCLAKIPYLYGFVQSYYWNVGFLKYFQLKQIPNFLLASPMLFLSVSAIISYICHNPKLCASLGLSATDDEYRLMTWQRGSPTVIIEMLEKAQHPVTKPDTAAVTVTDDEVRSLRRRWGKDDSIAKEARASAVHVQFPPANDADSGGKVECTHAHHKDRELIETKLVGCNEGKTGFYSPGVLCLICQLGFMVFFCVCVMHVQVATRFLASHPVVYWYGAMVMWKGRGMRRQNKAESESCEKEKTDDFTEEGQLTRAGRILWTVFLCYIVVGTLLFTNFYPFT